jgi:hypothetical protein
MGLLGDILGAAGGVTGAVIAGGQSRRNREAAETNLQDALDAINQLRIPDVEKMKLRAELLDKSALEGISEDPRLRLAQMQALEQLGQISETGYSDADRAGLSLALEQQAQADRAQREALLSNYRQRGLAGSGLEMQANLLANQGGATNRSQLARQQAVQGQQNRMAALNQMGSLGGAIRGQDYGIAADRAQAADRIAQFNASQRAATNAANSALLQQDYLNRANRVGMQTGALTGQANLNTSQANQMMGLSGAFMQGGLTSLGNAARDWETEKK